MNPSVVIPAPGTEYGEGPHRGTVRRTELSGDGTILAVYMTDGRRILRNVDPPVAVEGPPAPDTFLVHLNVTVPAGSRLESVVAQIEAALAVGISEETPDLYARASSVDVVLAEEV